ncbi:MAG: biotin/lipoyl-containing protein, partial [Campylobacterales bacterium]|nr:biotin/lipoyl-containing protein [Campylobacterales bacterium]
PTKSEKPVTSSESGLYTVTVNGVSYNVKVSEGANVEEITKVAPQSSPAAVPVESSGRGIEASLPGSVFKILVKVGDSVKEGQAVVILEAMKMEIEIPALCDGVVSEIKVAVGDSVDNGQVLVVL